MAKKRNKRRKSSGGASVKLTPKKYIQTRARKLPFYKCFINNNWEEIGMAVVVVARQQGGEKLVVGLYLMDVWCLGLKDTHYEFRMDNYEFDNEFVPHVYHSRDLDIEEIEPEFAQNLIYGAIEYAEDLGFEPHKDFNLTEYILDPVDSIEVIDIEFGKDGKPFYSSGPHDDVNRIMAILQKNVGIDNFHYAIGSHVFDEDEEDYDEDEDDDFMEENYEEEEGDKDDDDFAEEIEFEEVK